MTNTEKQVALSERWDIIRGLFEEYWQQRYRGANFKRTKKSGSYDDPHVNEPFLAFRHGIVITKQQLSEANARLECSRDEFVQALATRDKEISGLYIVRRCDYPGCNNASTGSLRAFCQYCRRFMWIPIVGPLIIIFAGDAHPKYDFCDIHTLGPVKR